MRYQSVVWINTNGFGQPASVVYNLGHESGPTVHSPRMKQFLEIVEHQLLEF
jgi:hypothetical protein